jgi:hypothetical protein
MVMAVREEHLEKVPSLIIVTPSGIVMAVREEQRLKAPLPIDVTESGIVIAPREEHPRKVLFGIDVTPCAKVTSVTSHRLMKLPVPEFTAVLGRGESPSSGSSSSSPWSSLSSSV